MSRRGTAFAIPSLFLAFALCAATARAQTTPAPSVAGPPPPPRAAAAADSATVPPLEQQARTREIIQRHLGRPYVWGASGLRSFDCSGFVWRVMLERGTVLKRTTARKYYFSLPRAPEEARWEFGNIVFFSGLKHCGIVDTREAFYHAAVTAGTHRSRFDPLWRGKVTGVRAMPGRGVGGSPAQRSPAAGSGS